MEQKGVTATVYFHSAKTTQDGGWRISFDLSGDDGLKVAQLNALSGILLQLAVIPVEAD